MWLIVEVEKKSLGMESTLKKMELSVTGFRDFKETEVR
jgi:hypothetical protein